MSTLEVSFETFEDRLTVLWLRRPLRSTDLIEPYVDAGWSSGGEATDGGKPPVLVDPNADFKPQSK